MRPMIRVIPVGGFLYHSGGLPANSRTPGELPPHQNYGTVAPQITIPGKGTQRQVAGSSREAGAFFQLMGLSGRTLRPVRTTEPLVEPAVTLDDLDLAHLRQHGIAPGVQPPGPQLQAAW